MRKRELCVEEIEIGRAGNKRHCRLSEKWVVVKGQNYNKLSGFDSCALRWLDEQQTEIIN